MRTSCIIWLLLGAWAWANIPNRYTISGTNLLTERLGWTGDGLMATQMMVRSDFTDNRNYTYASQTRRLIEERLNIDSAKRWTNWFTYDSGAPAGPGVMTRAGQTNGIAWRGGTNALLRIVAETNDTIRWPAWGTNNGMATVSAYLDGTPVPVTQIGTQKLAWRSTLDLTPGSHQLRVEAAHPSGLYTASATNGFTNSTAGETISDTHDATGNVTARIWKTGSTTNRTQAFTWDAKGRLLKVAERDNTQSGFDWKADYDPFGRRVRTTETAVTNGALLSQQFVLEQRYDPEVEFLEVGVIENGLLTWKLYGPDLNGVYGGLNGVGGFDAIIPRGELFCPVVGDSLGNLHGIYDQGHGSFDWFKSRVTAYGAVPGYKPVAMGHGYTVGHNSAWRGKYGDVHGSVAVGVRNLLWDSDIFLSSDPLGYAGNNTPHTAFNGIPTVYWDADGRVAKAVGNAISGAARDAWNHSVFGNAPPPREVVVHRDPTQGFWNRIFAGQRYVDQDGNRVEQSRDIVRVDSRGMGIDYAGGEPGGGMIKGGAKIGVSLWSRITSLFRGGGDDAARATVNEATGVLGSRGFELGNAVPVGGRALVQDLRNAPALINGRSFSGHALDQMQNRGIMPSVVENTITVGRQFPTAPGTIGYFDSVNRLRVIVNSQNGTVVTVIRGAP